MYSWKETFELCDKSNTFVANLNPGPVPSCTRTFSFLPLRYGAVGGTASQRGQLPFLSAYFSQPSKVGRLSESAYALRPLREGFLYVLIRRKEANYAWHSQYRVSDLASLEFIDADQPWAPAKPPFTGDGGVKGLSWMLRIQDMDSIEDLRFLYSPVPLTKNVRDKYRQQQKYRSTMTSVDVAELISAEPPRMDNVLTHDALELIAEYASDSKPALKEHLKSQAFAPLFPPPRQALLAEMRPDADRKAQRGVAVVLNDALGVVQELNAWRNASSDSLEAFMAQEDEEKVDNHRKFTIAFAIDNIRKLLEDEAEVTYHENQKLQKHIGVRYTDPEYQAGNRHVVVQSSGNYRTFRNPVHQQEVYKTELKSQRAESWDKYAPYIDEHMRQDFLKRYRAEVDKADTARDARTEDHLLWLQSEQLLQVLDLFDRNDTEQALLFEDQMGKAMTGMNGTEAGQALLERWREADVSRENLYWRSLAQNQQAAEAEVGTLFNERGLLEDLDSAALQDRMKKLVVLYDRGHALMDALAEGTGGPPSSYLVGGAMLINTLGNSLFQNKPATVLDKAANRVAMTLLHAQMGRYAKKIHFETRGGKPLSRGAAARIDRAATRSFDDALRGGSRGPMTEMRLGSVLTLLELWNLYNRLSVEDKNSRQYIEAVSAVVALTAVGIEIAAAAVAFGERSENAALRQGAKVFGGKLRLGAGILAGAAGFVGAWYDGQDALDNWRFGKYSLAGLYALRATTQLGAATLSITVGLAYAKPFFEYLLKKYGTQTFFGKAVSFGLQGSSALAARMALMLRLFFRINIVFLALMLIETFLLPNSLQRYFDHCTFRKERTNKTAETEEKEIKTMQNAVKDTL
ncbi:T6SS effector BTH_I2691 family protein [Pseudomonas sp. Irchel 3E13]|uniref:T6SS effector BTH_I2691 family protein n=1 Tax=Pseudomonas sp. Irchel 3E13 TaxID=2008975 RepID=UPI000BA31132|nr:T6SS effector BTH_I2691 family protein [Pseudomonas sp. Irchel 3E13]